MLLMRTRRAELYEVTMLSIKTQASGWARGMNGFVEQAQKVPVHSFSAIHFY